MIFDRLFPKQLDNAYRGHWLGIVLFLLSAGLKAGQGIATIVSTRDIVTTADGISFAGYSAAQTDTVLSLFAVLGMYLLVVPLMGVVALIRYRAMVPQLYAVLLLTQLGTRALHAFHPAFAAEAGAAAPMGFYVNLGILGLTVLGFALSLTDTTRHGRNLSMQSRSQEERQ